MHEERPEIDRAVIVGTPYRDIAGRFAVSKSAVERHAGEHLTAAIARTGELRDRINANALIAELRTLREVTLGVLEEARASDQHGMALRAIARLEKQAELVGRLAGELVERQAIETVDITFSEQWLRLRPRLLEALQPYPEACNALEVALRDVGA